MGVTKQVLLRIHGCYKANAALHSLYNCVALFQGCGKPQPRMFYLAWICLFLLVRYNVSPWTLHFVALLRLHVAQSNDSMCCCEARSVRSACVVMHASSRTCALRSKGRFTIRQLNWQTLVPLEHNVQADTITYDQLYQRH